MRRSKTSRITMTPKSKSTKKKKNQRIFYQTFPVVGEVPIAFYIPECKSREAYKKQIEDHGGIVINIFEPYMYQIKIERNKVKNKNFYAGIIYSSKLIDESIKAGRMMSSLDTFKIGMVKNGIPHKNLHRQGYTFLEVLKVFELAESIKNYKKMFKPEAWEKIANKDIIPGRPAKSLAQTFKKFKKVGKEAALKEILKKGKYSQYFSSPPGFSKECTIEKTPSTQFGSTTDESRENPDEEEEEADQQEDDDVEEFILAVDDLESVLAYNESDDISYNVNNNMKKINTRNLSDIYTDMEENQLRRVTGHKRVKIAEDTEISSPIYASDELIYHCKEKERISVTFKPQERLRLVSKNYSKSKKLDLFRMLYNELEYLSKIHAIKIDDLHMLFFEVSCDIGRLKKILTSESTSAPKRWDELSDLAVLSNFNSVEHKALCKERGPTEVSKRKRFLESR
ncbi:unnamed protein product [Moneuplotes crassus]|uniref:Uncharacterized protein n=1 Tax=Euplotes crassus TaxID=5936 RepID=A0AAD1UHE0_EUPCR|nr:unnamed protein product [Moneuplotes crassus]